MITARRPALRFFFTVAALCVAAVLCALPPLAPLAQAADVTKQDVERAANAGEFDKAYELLVRLAESGHAQAQSFLAFVLYEGEWGMPVDEMQAKAWMQKAYDQNDAYAHLFVALTNDPDTREENATDPSLIKTHDWQTNILYAAENGHPYAQHMMGDWAKEKYKYKEAIEWYRKASEPDRDYYAINYLVTVSLYQWPRRVRVEEIEARITSGNPLAYEALHAAYTFGLQAVVDYRKAYQYGILSQLYGNTPSIEATKEIFEFVSVDEREQLSDQAGNKLDTWTKNANTYVGQATVWCYVDGKIDSTCLVNAVEDHRFCESDYILWKFDNFIDFSAYQACRQSFFQSPSLESN